MSALGKNTPPIGDSTAGGAGGGGTPMRAEALEARFGDNSGVEMSCVLRSGEALRRNQTLELVVKASWVWLRARPRNFPVLTRWQLAQAQFHWGNPPPAAEPRTFTRILSGSEQTAERSSHYSSALAYELISQFRSISPCCGVVHSIGKLLEVRTILIARKE